jgi:hypothetical protein
MNFPSIRTMRVPISNLIYDFACVRHAVPIYVCLILHLPTDRRAQDARLGVDLRRPRGIVILKDMIPDTSTVLRIIFHARHECCYVAHTKAPDNYAYCSSQLSSW